MPEAEEIEFEWGGATKPRMFDSSRWCCAPETNQVKINFTMNNIEKDLICTLNSKYFYPRPIDLSFIQWASRRVFFTRISHEFLNIISWSMVTQLRQGVVLCNELQEHSVSWRFSDRQYRCGSRSGESLHVFELLAFPKSFCRSWGRGTFHHVLLISSHPQASSGRLWREHQISDQIKVSHKQK